MNPKRLSCFLFASLVVAFSIVGCGNGADDAATTAAMNSRNAQRQGSQGTPPSGTPVAGTTAGK